MRFLAIAMFLFLTGCKTEGDAVADIAARTVTLPDGTKILSEPKLDAQSQAVGMMYRDSLPNGRGMLFFQTKPVQQAYWMHNCRIPLDIVWLDETKKVVEIVRDAPPCQKPEEQCPAYGGHKLAQYVLELNGGEAKRHGIAVGSVLPF